MEKTCSVCGKVEGIWLLLIFHVVRWVQVIFTRPKAIKQLKQMSSVEESERVEEIFACYNEE